MATGPSTDISLLSLDDAKAWLNSTGDTDNDGIISDLINVVSARFNSECGRQLKSASYTETYDGNGKSYMYLRHYPLSSTDITITIDENRAFTDTDDQVTSTDVMLTTGQGLVELHDESFDKGTKNVQVEYTAGFSTSDASMLDLIGAAKEFLTLQWNRYSHKEMVNVRSESHEGGSITFEGDMPWSVRQVLRMYKDPRKV